MAAAAATQMDLTKPQDKLEMSHCRRTRGNTPPPALFSEIFAISSIPLSIALLISWSSRSTSMSLSIDLIEIDA